MNIFGADSIQGVAQQGCQSLTIDDIDRALAQPEYLILKRQHHYIEMEIGRFGVGSKSEDVTRVETSRGSSV